jgi:hypothetical protein
LIADSIGKEGSLRVSGNEEDVDILREFVHQVFTTGEADKGDVMSELLAPDGRDLRHDACEIWIHDAAPEGVVLSLVGQIDDSDSKLPLGCM